jgi:hypothetical protein
VPKPVRVKKPSRARSPSWVSMFRSLTPRRMARSWPLQSHGGWLVMMAVTRSRRVAGRGGRGMVRHYADPVTEVDRHATAYLAKLNV